MPHESFILFDFDTVHMRPLGRSWDEDVRRLLEHVPPFFREVERIRKLADLVFFLVDDPEGTFTFRVVVLESGISREALQAVSDLVSTSGAVGYVLVVGDREGRVAVVHSGMEGSRQAVVHENGVVHELDVYDEILSPLFNLGGVEQIRAFGDNLDN